MRSRWSSLLLAIWATVVPLLSVAATPAPAKAAGAPTRFDSLGSDAQRAQIWTSLMAVYQHRCSIISSGHLSSSSILNGEWLTSDRPVGYHVPNTENGEIDCHNGTWFRNLATAAGYNMTQLAEASGFVYRPAAEQYTGGTIERLGQALSRGLFNRDNPGNIPDYIKYIIALHHLTSMDVCQAVVDPGAGNDQHTRLLNQGARQITVHTFNSGTNTVTAVPYLYSYNDDHRQGDEYSIGFGVGIPGDSDGRPDCSQIASVLGTATLANAMAAAVASGQASGGGIPSGGTSGNNTEAPVECDAGFGFTWLICPAIKGAVKTIDWIKDNLIVPLLAEEPLITTSTNGAASYADAYRIWQEIRNFAAAIFIVIFFLIIFGTAIGWDNYTIKKVIPHLVAGAILMPLSWPICAIAIDIGNVLGVGIQSLLSSIIPAPPRIDFDRSISDVFFGEAAGAGAILLGVSGVFALTQLSLASVVTLLLGLLVLVLTLIYRKIMILFLIVISPLAFLAFVLPNTEKYYKLWWTQLVRLILMYPLVIMLIEIGRLFASIAGATPGIGTSEAAPLFQMAGLAVPLFAVGFVNNWAGKTMAFGQNLIKKGANQIDRQYGKDSDFGKARDQNRVNNAMLNQAKARQRGGFIGGVQSKFWGARSGVSTFGRGNAGLMAHQDALGKAKQTEGQAQGIRDLRAGRAGQPIGVDQEVDAAKHQYIGQATANRGQAVGLNAAVATAGGVGNWSTANQEAAAETARVAEITKYGENVAVAERAGRVRNNPIREAAYLSKLDSQADFEGKVAGTIAGHTDAERSVRAEYGLASREEARDFRLTQRRGSSRRIAREGATDEAGKAAGVIAGHAAAVQAEQQRLSALGLPAQRTAAETSLSRAAMTAAMTAQADSIAKREGTAVGVATADARLNAEAGASTASTLAAALARNTARVNRLATVSAGAATTGAKGAMTDYGKATGEVRGEDQLIQDEMNATGLTREQVISNRLTRRREAAASLAREGAGAEEGKINARVNSDQRFGEEHMSNLVGSAQLEERDNLAKGRETRAQRVAVQNSAEGHMTDRQVMLDARKTARDQIAGNVTSRLEGLAAEQEQYRQAAIQNDQTIAPTLRNKLIAARTKAAKGADAEAASRIAAVRAAEGYGGEGPTVNSRADRLATALTSAEIDQQKADGTIKSSAEGLREEENRIMRQQGIDPATASSAQRASAHAFMMKNIGDNAGSNAKGQLRKTFEEAIGENEGEEIGINNAQVELEAQRLIEESKRTPGTTPLDVNAATLQARRNIEDLKAGRTSDRNIITQSQALDAYRDKRAATLRATAAAAVSAGTGKVMGEGNALDAANLEGEAQIEADRLQTANPSMDRNAALTQARETVRKRAENTKNAVQNEADRLQRNNPGMTRYEAEERAHATIQGQMTTVNNDVEAEADQLQRANPALSRTDAVNQARTNVQTRLGLAPAPGASSIPLQRSRERMLESYGTAGREAAERQGTTQTGEVTAAVEASLDDNRADTSQRVNAANEAGKSKIAAEEAGVVAYNDAKIPSRSYGKVRESAVASKSDQLLEQRVKEASVTSVKLPSGDEVEIQDVPLDKPGVALLRKTVEDNLRTDPALAIAAARRIGVSSGTGVDNLLELRTTLFGGTDRQLVAPENLATWTKITASVKSSQLKKAPLQALTDLKPAEVADWSKGEVKNALAFYQQSRDAAQKEADDAASDLQAGRGNATDNQEKLTEALKRRNEIIAASDEFNQVLRAAFANNNTAQRMSSDMLGNLDKASKNQLEAVSPDVNGSKIIGSGPIQIRNYDTTTGVLTGTAEIFQGLKPEAQDALRVRIEKNKNREPALPQNLTTSLLAATPDGSDIGLAVAVADAAAADPNYRDSLIDALKTKNKLDSSDFGAIAPQPARPEEMPAGMQKYLANLPAYKGEKGKPTDFDVIANIYRAYSNPNYFSGYDPADRATVHDEYRKAVDSAFEQKRIIPPAPSPNPPPPTP